MKTNKKYVVGFGVDDGALGITVILQDGMTRSVVADMEQQEPLPTNDNAREAAECVVRTLHPVFNRLDDLGAGNPTAVVLSIAPDTDNGRRSSRVLEMIRQAAPGVLREIPFEKAARHLVMPADAPPAVTLARSAAMVVLHELSSIRQARL